MLRSHCTRSCAATANSQRLKLKLKKKLKIEQYIDHRTPRVQTFQYLYFISKSLKTHRCIIFTRGTANYIGLKNRRQNVLFNR